MDLHDSGPSFLIGVRELNLAVKTTRAKQRRVQDIHSVGSRNYLEMQNRLLWKVVLVNQSIIQ